MTKYKVTGKAFDRISGEPVGKQRTEVIDTNTNSLFRVCFTILQIKKAYESFWNDLNPHSKEIVFVQRIKRLD